MTSVGVCEGTTKTDSANGRIRAISPIIDIRSANRRSEPLIPWVPAPSTMTAEPGESE